MSVQPSQEEIDSELARLDALRRELRESRRKIKALEKRRPYCQQPGNCAAKARGACSVCHHALMSAARKAAWADPEVRARMSAASKAALADPEVRARMSAASKAALADPEVRARMSAARKAAWADPEVRARMSAARKAAWADPEVRARMSAASKAALADPEVRARMKLLPQFTAEQKKLYRKLRKFVSRDEALAEVLK